jgi:hypothetical protein
VTSEEHKVQEQIELNGAAAKPVSIDAQLDAAVSVPANCMVRGILTLIAPQIPRDRVVLAIVRCLGRMCGQVYCTSDAVIGGQRKKCSEAFFEAMCAVEVRLAAPSMPIARKPPNAEMAGG